MSLLGLGNIAPDEAAAAYSHSKDLPWFGPFRFVAIDHRRYLPYGDGRDVGGLHSALPSKASYFGRRQAAKSLVQQRIEQGPNVILLGTGDMAVGAFPPLLSLWRSKLLAHDDRIVVAPPMGVGKTLVSSAVIGAIRRCS